MMPLHQVSNRMPGNKKSDTEDFKALQNLAVVMTCLATPVSVLFYNPSYFYSSTGFADGGDMYSHIVEAIHLKELLENGTTNYWFDQVSLGYPMFTAYQPLPCFFIAVVMVVFNRLLSPLLVFRLVFVAVLILMPFSAFKSARRFGMRPVQGILLCLLTFTVQSWRKFGLEISAFVEYGLLTQAFGMLLLPLAVSCFYSWIFSMKMDTKTSTLPFLILVVTFLSNFFFGLYACILSAVMLIVKLIILQTSSYATMLEITYRFAKIHLSWLFLISWWIISCLVGYKYIGGLPWRADSEDGYPALFLLNKLTNGEIFDCGRSFPWLTILVLIGFIINSLKMARLQVSASSCSKEDRTFSFWLVISTVVSICLFLGRTTFSVFYDLIPFHAELEAVKYLNAIHYCGLLHASTSLTEIVDILSKFVFYIITLLSQTPEFAKSSGFLSYWQKASEVIRKRATAPMKTFETGLLALRLHADVVVQSIMVAIIAIPLLCNQFMTVGTQLTMTEINPDFIQGLTSLKNSSIDGRLLGHKALGTARSWDLAFIPQYTGKPGLMTYSRGYHDSLSIFYLESLTFNPEKAQLFADLLRMYNIHFLMTSWQLELDDAFMKASQMKKLVTIEDLVFYELLHEDSDYGYFDFVRIPGFICGDLKHIRETVLKTLDIYRVNSVLKINPRNIPDSKETVVVDVKKTGWLEGWRDFRERKVQVTWSWKQQQNDSGYIIDEIVKENSWKWIYSQIIEERQQGVEYQALVQVSDGGLSSPDYEHLLLKVTYHPFWKCFYYPVTDDFSLSMFSQSHFLDGKNYLAIDHVTPNLMSVSLPPGRYLVVFSYRFPGILKILAFVCVVCYARICVTYLRKNESSERMIVNVGCFADSSATVVEKSTFGSKSNMNVPKTESLETECSTKSGEDDDVFNTSKSLQEKCNSERFVSKDDKSPQDRWNNSSESLNSENDVNLEGVEGLQTNNSIESICSEAADKGKDSFQVHESIKNVSSEDGIKNVSSEDGIKNVSSEDSIKSLGSEDGIKTWKVKGRLRSYSLAAETRFQTDAISFLANSGKHLQAKTRPLELQSNPEEETEDLINLKAHVFPAVHREISSGEIKVGFADQKSLQDDSSDSQSDIDSSSVIESDLNAGFNKPYSENDYDRLKQEWDIDDSPSSHDGREMIDSQKSGFLVDDKNNNFEKNGDSDTESSTDNFDKDALVSISPAKEGNAAGLQRSSLETEEQDDSDSDASVVNLRDRLEKLYNSESDNFDNQDNYGGMVKQLRQTYIRQRRNTLSALPTFKK